MYMGFELPPDGKHHKKAAKVYVGVLLLDGISGW